MVKLKKLLKNIDVVVKGSKEIEITGVCEDSKFTKPNDLFIARKGKVFDGTHFIPEAIRGGATCLLTDLYNPFYPKITQIISPDVKKTALKIAKAYYENPQDSLVMIGITGTSGKTTVSYLVKHLLDHIDMQAGVIGTNGYQIKDSVLAASRTTPDNITSLKILKDAVNKNLKSVVMEVSSHGLDQERVDFIPFNAAIFTNITHEHLDYHGSMDEYFNAKKKLFSLLDLSHKKNTCAIINADDPKSSDLVENISVKTLTYGIHSKADVLAKDLTLTIDGMSFTLCYNGEEEHFSSKLVGEFNVYNLLAAISMGIHYQKSLEELSKIFSSFSLVEGRLQKVLEYKKCHVFVDYAHKVEALKNVLMTLRANAKGKIITVFGCGGNRDRMKRKLMAKMAETYSDFTIVTDDNSRNEDPKKIISEIVLGFTKNRHLIVSDRREAIKKALDMASSNDIVLIAGKGHEKVQIYSHKTLPFDDKEVVCEFVGE